MSKFIVLILVGWAILIGFMMGEIQDIKNTASSYTACSSPQHEGEKTIGTLVKRKGVLTLVCEYHSLLKYTDSPNRGEKK